MLDAFMERCRNDAAATFCGNGRILCRALGQYHVFVEADDIGLTPNLVCDGFWEPGISLVFERFLKPGMVAVDVGANIGYFSLMMASKVGLEGHVVAVEANPKTADLLRDTIAINACEDRIELHNVALADVKGELAFHVVPQRNLNACLVTDILKDRVDPDLVQKVPALRGDELLEKHERIDFIKIDVEGAEQLVWDGLEQTWARNHDIIIVLEFNGVRLADPEHLINQIVEHGFHLRAIDEQGGIVAIERSELLDPLHREDFMLFLSRNDGIAQ